MKFEKSLLRNQMIVGLYPFNWIIIIQITIICIPITSPAIVDKYPVPEPIFKNESPGASCNPSKTWNYQNEA